MFSDQKTLTYNYYAGEEEKQRRIVLLNPSIFFGGFFGTGRFVVNPTPQWEQA